MHISYLGLNLAFSGKVCKVTPGCVKSPQLTVYKKGRGREALIGGATEFELAMFKRCKMRFFSAIISKSVNNHCYKPHIFAKIFSSSTIRKKSNIHSRQC